MRIKVNDKEVQRLRGEVIRVRENGVTAVTKIKDKKKMPEIYALVGGAASSSLASVGLSAEANK